MLLKLRTYLEMIRFSHTVFALPFALMGAVLAAGGIPSGDKLLWILVAMVGARSGAMGMNRFASSSNGISISVPHAHGDEPGQRPAAWTVSQCSPRAWG